MNNQPKLTLVSIADLHDKSFLIPSYQRGYRWTVQQVEDLLDDILEFSKKINKNADAWYCLQPVVVTNVGNVFHVLDGQQRLTTIFLILNYLNNRYVEDERISIFDLAYETRPSSGDFLKNKLSKNEINDSNIDYFFISSAYKKIADWFSEHKNKIKINDYESNFLHDTKVIWYEVDNSQSIEIFTRLNMGKIPLTNAELVKALFLNSSNFKNDNENDEKVRVTQLEIASEWDSIEYTLQNDGFWYFLNNDNNHFSTRIELVLNLVAGIEPKQSDEYSTFRYFSNHFQESESKIQAIKTNWEKVKRAFQTLEEWYEDRTLYHKIGFLITTGKSIKEIMSCATGKSKAQFKETLNKLIYDSVTNKNNNLKEHIENIQYGSEYVRHILLLHNIQTMLENINESSKFPFDRFKKEKWDVEHISAVQEEMPKTIRFQKEWLEQTKEYIKEAPELSKEIESYITQISGDIDKKANEDNSKEFEPLFLAILKYFAEEGTVDDTNDISNLVLLDQHTNRSYKNGIYPLKRSKIIAREKEGTFVPICTKNVFMKFYNGNVSQMTFWGDSDRNSYLADILEKLKIYQFDN